MVNLVTNLVFGIDRYEKPRTFADGRKCLGRNLFGERKTLIEINRSTKINRTSEISWSIANRRTFQRKCGSRYVVFIRPVHIHVYGAFPDSTVLNLSIQNLSSPRPIADYLGVYQARYTQHLDIQRTGIAAGSGSVHVKIGR